MNAPRTSRPFQERFLSGYYRKPLQLSSLPKKCATMALGVSLALGGISGPLSRKATPPAARRPAPHLAAGLQTAEEITVLLKVSVGSGVEAVSDEIKADFFLKQVPFGSIIYNAAKKNNISPELVAAVARAESAFHPSARSNRGAVGVMQLVPRTGRWLGATDLTDPMQNIVAGAKYLRYLSDRFGGNEDHVIAAYNAGEGNVRRFDGVPPFNETRDYVERVHRFQRDLRTQMTVQVADASSYRERFETMPARSRPKIDIHWTTPEERRVRRAS
jgi:hypothetical protein